MRSDRERRMVGLPKSPGIALLIFGICSLLVVSWTCPGHAAEPRSVSPLEELVSQSTFIFEGTVTKLQAATMSAVPVSDKTIIVKVGEIYHGQEFLGDYRGREITVLVTDSTALGAGEHATFFAQGWLLGDGIAVQEVGRLERESTMDLRKQIAATRQSISGQDIQERIAGADVVVLGKVSKVKAVAPRRPGPISEHDPHWQEATLEVDTVLQGDPSLRRIPVLFPGTLDVAWVGVPKFKAGQEGIWILVRDRKLKAYTALDPLDFQAKNQLDQVRTLIKRTKKTPKK